MSLGFITGSWDLVAKRGLWSRIYPCYQPHTKTWGPKTRGLPSAEAPPTGWRTFLWEQNFRIRAHCLCTLWTHIVSSLWVLGCNENPSTKGYGVLWILLPCKMQPGYHSQMVAEVESEQAQAACPLACSFKHRVWLLPRVGVSIITPSLRLPSRPSLMDTQ